MIADSHCWGEIVRGISTFTQFTRQAHLGCWNNTMKMDSIKWGNDHICDMICVKMGICMVVICTTIRISHIYIYIIYNKYTDIYIYIGYPFCGDQMVVVELTSGFWQL